MVLVVLSRCIDALRRSEVPEESTSLEALSQFCESTFPSLLRTIGYEVPLITLPKERSLQGLLGWMEVSLSGALGELAQYLKKIAFPGADLVYDGPLGNYVDLLCPFVEALRSLPLLPSGPVYLLIDDADNLSETQTRVLNEWVSTRSTGEVCLKVSTQLRYKTFRTITGGTISTPHDYDEINISAVYTSQKSKYRDRMHSIITKRLELYHINGSPEDFFPFDTNQEQAIEALRKGYMDQGDDAARGARARDDAHTVCTTRLH